MATIASFLKVEHILCAPPHLRPALLAVAPAGVQREIAARHRAWEVYVHNLHTLAAQGAMPGCEPTRSGGVRLSPRRRLIEAGLLKPAS